MIKANKAQEVTKEVIRKEKEARLAKMREFLDTECDSAVCAAANLGQFSCFVTVPEELKEYTSTICAMLYAEGYSAQVRHGSDVAILIKWDK